LVLYQAGDQFGAATSSHLQHGTPVYQDYTQYHYSCTTDIH